VSAAERALLQSIAVRTSSPNNTPRTRWPPVTAPAPSNESVESMLTELERVNLKYNQLVDERGKNDARIKSIIEALQSKIVALEQQFDAQTEGPSKAMEEVGSLRRQLAQSGRTKTVQQLILLNGILGSAHYACFIPSVLEAVTLRPSAHALKCLAISAGLNAMNGFYALTVLSKAKPSGERVVRYMAVSNVLSIAAACYCYYRKPMAVKREYLMLSSAANAGLLSLSLSLMAKLKRNYHSEHEAVLNGMISQ